MVRDVSADGSALINIVQHQHAVCSANGLIVDLNPSRWMVVADTITKVTSGIEDTMYRVADVFQQPGGPAINRPRDGDSPAAAIAGISFR